MGRSEGESYVAGALRVHHQQFRSFEEARGPLATLLTGEIVLAGLAERERASRFFVSRVKKKRRQHTDVPEPVGRLRRPAEPGGLDAPVAQLVVGPVRVLAAGLTIFGLLLPQVVFVVEVGRDVLIKVHAALAIGRLVAAMLCRLV